MNVATVELGLDLPKMGHDQPATWPHNLKICKKPAKEAKSPDRNVVWACPIWENPHGLGAAKVCGEATVHSLITHDCVAGTCLLA